ncbi:MAG TPA: CHRD domain-containing protein [Xanthomonadaceae bacterium]|nr:CHRD domain-containing protein [Xanthomonadaceae bacterium]
MPRSLILGALLALAAGAASAATLELRATLNGANVVSSTDSPATGEARATLDDDNRLRLTLVFGGTTSEVTGVALHVGDSSANGPIAETLDTGREQDGRRRVEQTLTLEDSVAARMRAGETYLEVTTADHPGGAIRGQLQPQPVRLRDMPAEPEEETP